MIDSNETFISLRSHIKSLKVSSTLNNDRSLGKQNLLTDDNETCWNSGEGKQQFIIINFNKTINLNHFTIQFQGGFVCRQIELVTVTFGGLSKLTNTVEPNDSNSNQIFQCKCDNISSVKLIMSNPSDFFGRIIVYRLDLFGNVTE